jgi:hypothetical protein
MIRVEYPTRLVSVLNAREHWSVRAKRTKRERTSAMLMLQSAWKFQRPAFPLVVTVTRIAPRSLDSHDNLGASCKATIDSVAEWLGIPDNDPRVEFKTAQECGKPRFYGVRIEVAHVE